MMRKKAAYSKIIARAIPKSSKNRTSAPPTHRFAVYDKIHKTYVGMHDAVVLFNTEQSAQDMKNLCMYNHIEFVECLACNEYAIWDVKHTKLNRPRHLETCIIADDAHFINEVSKMGVKVFDVFYTPNMYSMVGLVKSKDYSLRDRVDALETLI